MAVQALLNFSPEKSPAVITQNYSEAVLFLAAIIDLVLGLVFWTKMLFSFSQILVTSICDSFSPVLVDETFLI